MKIRQIRNATLRINFGGEVHGVPLGDGNYHCFNKVGDAVFDLTSEQFDHPLAYTMDFPQSRETHFAKTEKKERYDILKSSLVQLCVSCGK